PSLTPFSPSPDERRGVRTLVTSRHRVGYSMIGASVAVLAAGFALQLAMYSHGGHVALSDLPRVLLHRGIGPGALPYIDRVLEYPVGSGVLLYLASVVGSGPLGALAVTAAAAAGLCVMLTAVFERRFGARAWRW